MRLVAKVGSRILADDPEGRVDALAGQAAALRARGADVVMVSSGAIALGVRRLGLAERPRAIPALQAAAAVGQGQLMQLWERALKQRGLIAAQILLTHADVADRQRFLNARHAIAALCAHGAVPVINENDTVATEEIRFGDNDRLAALTANVVEADLVIVLTDVAGLLDGEGRVVPEVTDAAAAAALASGAGSSMGTGGMASKVEAARIAGRFGVPTVVASGREPDALVRIVAGERIGTRFVPPPGALGSRKHWLAYAPRHAGTLVVDDGARRALVEANKSLLPSGVREVRGDFDLGAVVAIADESGREFARGLAGYPSTDLRRIAGRKTSEIEGVLGYRLLDEVVHRDDLVLL